LVQIPALKMETYRRTSNRVALSFLPNMHGSQGVESVLDVTIAFFQAGDQEGVRLLFAFWVVEGRLNSVEQNELNRKLKERDMPEIIDWWRQEGIEIGMEKGVEKGVQATQIDNARKMREHGIAWEIVTDVTGIKTAQILPEPDGINPPAARRNKAQRRADDPAEGTPTSGKKTSTTISSSTARGTGFNVVIAS